MLVADFLQI